ncbi:MAG: hypothetical protein HY530_06785 [Chloroflexi bacterium]|nr:hypothetical protein [Chloroflexota bacterium]
MTREVGLMVNDKTVPADYFVQGFIDHVVSSMIEALEGVCEIKSVALSAEGEKVTINMNGAELDINPFVARIVRSTVTGMVSPLKGVGEIRKVNISIKR